MRVVRGGAQQVIDGGVQSPFRVEAFGLGEQFVGAFFAVADFLANLGEVLIALGKRLQEPFAGGEGPRIHAATGLIQSPPPIGILPGNFLGHGHDLFAQLGNLLRRPTAALGLAQVDEGFGEAFGPVMLPGPFGQGLGQFRAERLAAGVAGDVRLLDESEGVVKLTLLNRPLGRFQSDGK